MPQKITATDDVLQVYEHQDLDSRVIAQANKGLEIELGEATVHEGREWIEASLEDGTRGYVLGASARGHTTLGGTQLASTTSAVPRTITSSEGRCPNCKIINMAGTQRCECGYNFASGRVEEGSPEWAEGPTAWKAKRAFAKSKKQNLILGLISFLLIVLWKLVVGGMVGSALTIGSVLFGTLFLIAASRKFKD
jgi:hypothetical protein